MTHRLQDLARADHEDGDLPRGMGTLEGLRRRLPWSRSWTPVPCLAAAAAGAVAVALLAPGTASLILGALAVLLALVGRAQRSDPLFLARRLGLSPSVISILETTIRIRDHLRRTGAVGSFPVLNGMPRRLESLGSRALRLGLARLDIGAGPAVSGFPVGPEPDAPDAVQDDLSRIEARLASCSDRAVRRHLRRAQSHLLRERRSRDRLERLAERTASQLYALERFFLATEAELHGVTARLVAGDPHERPERVRETMEIVHAMTDLEHVLMELEAVPGKAPAASIADDRAPGEGISVVTRGATPRSPPRCLP